MLFSFRWVLTNRPWQLFAPTDEENSCWTQLMPLWLCECTCISVPHVSTGSDTSTSNIQRFPTLISTNFVSYAQPPLCPCAKSQHAHLQNLNYSCIYVSGILPLRHMEHMTKWMIVSVSSDLIQSILLHLQLVLVCSQVSHGEGLSWASLPLCSDWCYHGKTGSH